VQAGHRAGGRAIDYGMAIDRPRMKRHAITLGDICRRGGAVHPLGPAYIRSGLSALLIFYHSAEAASPYKNRGQHPATPACRAAVISRCTQS